MLSIKNIYRIGPGPSSSHTIGPKKAVEYILNHYSNIDFVKMTFYGSLAHTGKGHLSDLIADRTFGELPHQIIFDYETKTRHPNTMIFELYKNQKLIKKVTILSIGGGLIKVNNKEEEKLTDCYKEENFTSIKKYCKEHNLSLIDYIYQNEDDDIFQFGSFIVDKMISVIESGLNKDGVLPGKLKVQRKAKEIYNHIGKNESDDIKEKRLVSAYAFATSEENASGQEIVTAPTCGASGIIPSLVKYQLDKNVDRKKVIEGLLVAGLIGTIIQHNASISGAECGCQAEIGSASAMGAAMLAYIDNQDIDGIERASEISLEHSLGLTCDPVEGYVQIPCIERNALGAIRSITSCSLSKFMEGISSKINLDIAIETMYQTGKDLNRRYKETSKGGLAKNYYLK